MTKHNEGIWIIGYGSLIYKPPPYWKHRVPGIVHGFVRRFWQSSIDHRGTPASPGRVATLIPYEKIVCNPDFEQDLGMWRGTNPGGRYDLRLLAVAYYIPPEYAQLVTEYLDIREQNGYSIHKITIHLMKDKNQDCELQTLLEQLPVHQQSGKHILESTVYIGTEDNEAFVGIENIIDTANIIAGNEGPSGPNYEYLKLLHDSLSEMASELNESLECIEDSYLSALLAQTELIRREKEKENVSTTM